MEAVLDLYAEPFDPQRPVVCFDESPLALTAATRAALPMAPGRPRREDYEYERRGSCNLLVSFQPGGGWRTIQVTARRTKTEFAEQLRVLAEERFPDVSTIRVVLDNLNTHTPAALYETFPVEQARRLARRIEFCYTPKHGSWLNMVEIELAVLNQQCLRRHLPDIATVQQQVDAWAAARNATHATVAWRFAVPDARRRLERLYPIPTSTRNTPT
jgi:hypothetical protein